MGRFSCQLIIDSRMLVHDPPGSGSGYRFTIHDLIVRDEITAENRRKPQIYREDDHSSAFISRSL